MLHYMVQLLVRPTSMELLVSVFVFVILVLQQLLRREVGCEYDWRYRCYSRRFWTKFAAGMSGGIAYLYSADGLLMIVILTWK